MKSVRVFAFYSVCFTGKINVSLMRRQQPAVVFHHLLPSPLPRGNKTKQLTFNEANT